MRKHLLLGCAIAVAASVVIATPASAASTIDTKELRTAVTVNGIREHLAALEKIAKSNKFQHIPTRATGTPGHEASVDYVVQKMRAAGFQGLRYETIPFDGRSDYDAFTNVGIPAGGIFAGAEVIKQPYQVPLYGGTAGVAFDKCYHQLCDDLRNINNKGLDEHSDAAVHAILTFAQTESAVSGTDKGSSTTSTKPKEFKGHHKVR
jgi:hypothetical protein